MNKILSKRNLKIWLSFLLVLVICVSAVVYMGIRSKALNEYNETDASFDDFEEARIDSDVEVKYGVGAYQQSTVFSKSGKTASIDTNAYVEWTTASDVAFLYKKYDVSGTGNDNKMVFETSITSRTDLHGGQDIFSTGSGGLLLTDSVTDPSAPRIFLHLREGKVTVVYRTEQNKGMGVIYGNVGADLPIKLRIEKTGKKYTCSYKGANNGSYVSLGTVTSTFNGPLYAGVGAHSSDRQRSIRCAFSGWYAVGSGSYDSSDSSSGSSSKDNYPDTDYIDPSFDEANTLLFESFKKGIRTLGDDTVDSPKWKSAHTDLVKTLDDGNRVWYIAQEIGSSYLGNEKWTDYSASIDFSFTNEMQAQDDDTFVFWVRQKHIANSGYYGNGISITTDFDTDKVTGEISYTTKLSVVKQYAQRPDKWNGTDTSVTIPNLIGDGLTHNLKVYSIDNKTAVYLDGALVLEYTDSSKDGHINLRGGIGFYTNAVDMTVDNILVEKLDDENGGDFDNIIGSRFDEDMPDYIREFYKRNEIKYFNNDSSVAVEK